VEPVEEKLVEAEEHPVESEEDYGDSSG